jgi:hypothetical protein
VSTPKPAKPTGWHIITKPPPEMLNADGAWNECGAPGCDALIAADVLMCREDWALVPPGPSW